MHHFGLLCERDLGEWHLACWIGITPIRLHKNDRLQHNFLFKLRSIISPMAYLGACNSHLDNVCLVSIRLNLDCTLLPICTLSYIIDNLLGMIRTFPPPDWSVSSSYICVSGVAWLSQCFLLVFSFQRQSDMALQCRHNYVSNQQPRECLLNLFDSGADQRKHQSSASLPFARGIHRWPVKSPHKWPVTRKMFPFDDIIMETIKTTRCVCR